MRRLWFLIFIPLLAFAEEPITSHIVTPRGETNPLIENKNIVQEFYNAFTKNDSQAMDELLGARYSIQDSTVVFDSAYSKYDAFSKNMNVRIKSLHEALPNFKLKVVEMMAEGNRVLARIQISGVQRGSFLGVEATNKPVTIKMFAIFKIDGGKITHINEFWNEFGVMKQIGYIIL